MGLRKSRNTGVIPPSQTVASYADLPLTDRSEAEMWFVTENNDIVVSTQLSPVVWRSVSDFTAVASVIPDSDVFYDAYDTSTLLSGGSVVSDGNSSDTWVNSAGGQNLTGGSPVRADDGINSQTALDFSANSDTLSAGTTSDYNFLHDGSAFTIYIVTRNEGTTNSDGYNTIATKDNFSGGSVGFSFARDNRTALGADDSLIFEIGNGSSVMRTDVTKEYPSGSNEIFVGVHNPNSAPTLQSYRGKTQVATHTNTSFSYSSNDSKYPLTLGDIGDQSVGYEGKHGEFRIFQNAAHDTATLEDIVDVLAGKWNKTI